MNCDQIANSSSQKQQLAASSNVFHSSVKASHDSFERGDAVRSKAVRTRGQVSTLSFASAVFSSYRYIQVDGGFMETHSRSTDFLAEPGLPKGLRVRRSVSGTKSSIAPVRYSPLSELSQLGETEADKMPAPLSALSQVANCSDARWPQWNQLIGTGPGMQKVFALIRKVAPSDVNVLVTGESGSGKEMVASAIHRCSSRAGKPFITINCAAIPRELLESELFGHAKGAFTGASSSRRGLFEEAHEGTILLDEIGDLPLPLQAKILRLLQTKEIKPLGQNAIKEVNVRIISATHKNLKAMIHQGEFREDLYYRLNVMPIQLLPLRERREDIPILAEFFLHKHAASARRPPHGFSKSALQKLNTLPWRGNVRELENAIARALVLADGPQIEEKDIVVEDITTPSTASGIDDFFNRSMSLKDIEREYIQHVLQRTENRKDAATQILGIDRKTLYRKEKLYGFRI